MIIVQVSFKMFYYEGSTKFQSNWATPNSCRKSASWMLF